MGAAREEVPLDTLIAHMDHVCQIAGDSLHAGIGSDFDGGFGLQSIPPELDSIADLQVISSGLIARGYSEIGCGEYSGWQLVEIPSEEFARMNGESHKWYFQFAEPFQLNSGCIRFIDLCRWCKAQLVWLGTDAGSGLHPDRRLSGWACRDLFGGVYRAFCIVGQGTAQHHRRYWYPPRCNGICDYCLYRAGRRVWHGQPDPPQCALFRTMAGRGCAARRDRDRGRVPDGHPLSLLFQ